MRESADQRVSRREQLLRDALAAWDDYRTTGLHLTGEEADKWLAKLENGECVEAPECHT
jgi:predicted transcriptional regulator